MINGPRRSRIGPKLTEIRASKVEKKKRKTYGVSWTQVPGGRVAAAGARQAVAEFQGQTMNQTDVVAFFVKYVNTTATPRRDARIWYLASPVSRKPRGFPVFFDFGGPYLGQFGSDSAPSWTVDHLCTSSRDLDTKIARIDSYKVMLKRS